MANHEVVIIGLPSSGLQTLAASLAIGQINDDADMHASYRGPDGSLEFAPQSLAGRWARYLGDSGTAKVLLAYRTPWGFLEDQLRTAAIAPGTPAQLESVVRSALGFWRAYHLAMLGLRRERERQVLLLNADRPMDLNAVQDLVERRFLLRPALVQVAAGEEACAAASHESIFYDMVDSRAPECMETYAALESCAELMGRKPEFEIDGQARRIGILPDVLELFASQHTLQTSLASANARMESLKNENVLYLLQLSQIQEELARCFEINQQNEVRLADLQRQLVSENAMLERRIAHRVLSFWKSGTAVIALSERSPLRRLWQGRERERILRKQMQAIRLSGLFDEAWYRNTYLDVAQAGLDPVEHYLRHGASEARNPSANFDSRWYLETNPDVVESGMNPLLHYIEFGRNENRQPMRSIARAMRPAPLQAGFARRDRQQSRQTSRRSIGRVPGTDNRR